jgi:hypothetical protein
VLLGLSLAMAALRLFRRNALGWGAIASAGAILSVEQALFAMPLAVWLVVPPENRRRATTVAALTAGIVLVAYATWPGSNPRQAVSLAERLANVASQPEWYVFFPAANLGLYSGAIGFLWALPWSLAIVGFGAFLGARSGPSLLAVDPGPGLGRHALGSGLLGTAALVLLVNLPLIVTEVGYSARTFTPTWLVLAAASAIIGAHVAWRRFRLVGALAGTFAAFALLSLGLSVWVRISTGRFDEAAAHWIAERTQDGDIVAVCDVGRTVVEPAPLGAFHLHAFHSTLGDWIQYHTGRVVDVRRSGERYWGSRCPDLTGADLVIDFPELVEAVERSLDGGTVLEAGRSGRGPRASANASFLPSGYRLPSRGAVARGSPIHGEPVSATSNAGISGWPCTVWRWRRAGGEEAFGRSPASRSWDT